MDSPSAIAATEYGSVFISHGSKITYFDWSLQRKSTTLTQFNAIDSLLCLSNNVVAAGATDFCGLQIIDLESGFVEKSLEWENVTKSGSTVQGVGVSNEFLFTSFESSRRNSNTILVYDLIGFRAVLENGHNEIYGADFDLAIPSTKLDWIPSLNLLMGSGSHGGPSGIHPFDLEKCLILPLSGRDSPSAIAATENGSVFVSHGSKITSFDWSLQRKSTILTQFNAIDSLLCLSNNVVAAGATDFCGLQIIDLESGFVEKSLEWENVTKSGSTVQGVGVSNEFLFTSFESSRRNSNTILVYDLNDGFRAVSEIGHNEIYGADFDSAIPSAKLDWIPSLNLLMASGSHSGPSGISGNIKFWDIRSGNLVSEIKEKVDCFSDITISDSLSAVFKIGMNSGEVSYMDFRNIASDGSWNCLGDSRKLANVKKEGFGCKIESHGNQVFCSKEGELELWSEVLMGSSTTTSKNGKEERVFKKNILGRSKDIGGARITSLAIDGNKMFITRKDQQCVEVWQSSVRRS